LHRAHCACLLLQGEAKALSISIYPQPLSTRPHLGPFSPLRFRDTPVSSSPAITFRSAYYNSPLETRLYIVAPLCRTFLQAGLWAQADVTEGLALSGSTVGLFVSSLSFLILAGTSRLCWPSSYQTPDSSFLLMSCHPPVRKREVLFNSIEGLFSPPGRIDGRVAYQGRPIH
jgi:hypothetical protein